MALNIKNLISNVTGKGIKDDRNLKSIHKIGNLYSNIRNVGLLYKYYGNLVLLEQDFLKFMELLNSSSKHGNPLRCEIIVQNAGGVKTYYLCFWYGSTLAYNSHQLKDHREVFDHYYALNGLRQTIQNMDVFSNRLEYVDYFSFFPQSDGNKNGLAYMNEAITKLAKTKENVFKKKVEILHSNLIEVLEARGIDRTNYQFSIGKDLFGKNLSFTPTTVEERFYEKMLAFGFYMGDNDFYFPLGVKAIPFETSNELIMEFDMQKMFRLLDKHLEDGTFYHYSVNITFSPTNGIQIGGDDTYKIGTDRTRKFEGVSKAKEFIYGTTFMIHLFSKENDISRFYRDVDTEFQQHIELTPLDGLVPSNEGFMVQNDYFNMGKFYSTPDNLRDFFYTMKQYKAPMKDGVYFGIDFFSKNPFIVNILDMAGKGDGGKDRTLQSSAHTLVLGESGKGKTFLMKKFYEGVTAEQLLVLDNKGNFQEIAPEKRGLVLKYGKDIASIIGHISDADIARESFLLYGKNKDKFVANIIEMFRKRGNEKADTATVGLVADTFTNAGGRWEDESMKALGLELGLLNVLKTQFSSTVREAVDEIMVSNHYKRIITVDQKKVIHYSDAMSEDVLKRIEKGIETYLFDFMNENIDEKMLIEDLRKYVEKHSAEDPVKNQIKTALSYEVDFPNFIGVINENNRTTKESILYDLILGSSSLDEVYKTQIRGVISSYFLVNDFFRYDYFYQFVKSNTVIDNEIRKLMIPLLDSLDSRTVSILNRSTSLMEDILASGMYQKIVLSNEYIMNEMKNVTAKGILTGVLLDSMYGYVELVRIGKIDNKFDYSTIIIDEAHNYLEHTYIVSHIKKGIRELRNNRGHIILISQHYTDFHMLQDTDIAFKIFVSPAEYTAFKEKQTDEKFLAKLNALDKGISDWYKIANELEEMEKKTGRSDPTQAYKKRFIMFIDNKNDPYLLYPKF